MYSQFQEKLNTSIKFIITNEEDLDRCNKELSTNPNLLNCTLIFENRSPLPQEKIMLLKGHLESQKNIQVLTLKVTPESGKLNQITTLLGDALIPLVFLKSLTLSGFITKNTFQVLAKLLNRSSPCLKNLCVGPYGERVSPSEEDIELFAEALKQNTTLISLDLRSCGIGHIGVLAIAAAVKNHKNLKTIDLTHNDTYPNVESDIIKALELNPGLEEIKLTRTHITPTMFVRFVINSQQDFEQILNSLSRLKDLTSLDLSYKDLMLSRQQGKQLFSLINDMKNLQVLQLKFCQGNIDLKTVCEEVLATHPSINQFTFNVSNFLDEKSAVALAHLIKNNSRLISLSIVNSNATSNWMPKFLPKKAVSAIFKALELNKSLEHFDLSCIWFEDGNNVANDIAIMIKRNTTLKSLTLVQVFIAIAKVIEVLPQNHTLKKLNLSCNNALISHSTLNRLKENTQITEFIIKGRQFDPLDNILPVEAEEEIQQFLTRNLNWELYQRYILLKQSFPSLPLEILTIIFLTSVINSYRNDQLASCSNMIKEGKPYQLIALDNEQNLKEDEDATELELLTKSSQSDCFSLTNMQIIGAFMAVLGIAAVALALTILSGYVIIPGIALTIAGIGFFATPIDCKMPCMDKSPAFSL